MMTDQDKEDILKMNEVETYFLIDECGAFIWRMNHDMSHPGRIPDESHEAIKEDVKNIREVQEFTVDNLTRFGVDPTTAKDREKGEYWKWFKHWDNWKKGLSNEVWEKVSQGQYNEYLPETNWKGEKV